MKKKVIGIVMGAMLAFGMLCFAGCAGGTNNAENGSDASGDSSNAPAAAETSPSGQISVYSREDGSGTRGAFIELFGIEQKDASGEKVDMTALSASITNSTSVMMTSVAGDERGIGYISLGSLDESAVKALKIDGAEPTAENVKSGEYKIARPFNIATKDGLSEVSQDFIDFIMSADGQKIVEDNGYIAVADGAEAYSGSGKSGKVVVAGSSSVTPVMEKLSEAYKEKNPDVTIEVQQSDSTTGMNMATEGTCDIGMASRELKDSEISGGLTPTVIAQDGIAVIVNKNASIDELTSDQVMGIYLGELATWEDVLA
ncbi:substrate-binding domain-containing protein [Raoultibacter phocaeensis]|uniref:substrate-binding domain-containing protein n=1 Tax=Raoultibacter phocaeensis TaxID=2479841 RepID=UPI001118DD93|nr:substrate-binding domain-containing protein [Raoultibacter phocaeensis]